MVGGWKGSASWLAGASFLTVLLWQGRGSAPYWRKAVVPPDCGPLLDAIYYPHHGRAWNRVVLFKVTSL